MAAPPSHFIVGLPRSGKSTFLGALWYVAARTPLDGALRATQIGAKTQYIEGLCETWLSCEETVKTPVDVGASVMLRIDDPATGQSAEIALPDISGEEFRSGFSRRNWPIDLAEGIGAAKGVVIFIHPDIRQPRSLGPAVESLTAAGIALGGDGIQKGPESFSPDECPTAAQLTDLLQSILKLKPGKVELTFVVSAWDLVLADKADVRPIDWLFQELPLVAQHLRSNSDRYDYRVLGVSAQGGGLEKPEFVERLQAIDDPRKRPIVTDGTNTVNDLTLAIRHMLRWV